MVEWKVARAEGECCRFLRERGIRATNVRSGFSRRINEDEGTPAAEAGPSGSASPAPVAGPSGRTAGLDSIGEGDVDDLGTSSFTGDTPDVSRVGSTAPGTPAFEEDEDSVMVASSSRSVTVTASTSNSISVKKVNKKKKKKDEDEDDYEENKDDFFEVPPAKKARYGDRKPGSFAMCAECNKKVRVAFAAPRRVNHISPS